MAIREILVYPDLKLKAHARPVESFDADLSRLVWDLSDTLYATSAIALSAPQIDEQQSVLLMDLSENRDTPQIFINPQITAKRGMGFVEESCLSVPGIVGNVMRAMAVRVRAQDETGAEFEKNLEGMDAVCLQHEIDHLMGKLVVDRMSVFKRLSLRAGHALKERRAQSAAGQAR